MAKGRKDDRPAGGSQAVTIAPAIAADSTGRSTPASLAFWALLVFLASAATFWPATSQSFIALDDDYNFLVPQTELWRGLSLDNLAWMWTTSWLGHWQPLSWMSLALDYKIAGGLDPGGTVQRVDLFPHLAGQIHTTNILLHAGGAVMLFFVARRILAASMFGSQRAWSSTLDACAFAATLVYAVHPLRVESVAWATERRDVQSGFFLVATLLCYLKRWDGGDVRWTFTALLCYALSLTSKAWGMTFPAVLIAIDVFPLARRDFAKLALEKWSYALLAAVCGGMAWWAQRESAAVVPWSEHGLVQRFAQCCYGLCFYVWKTIWPTNLSPIYILESNLDPTRSIYVASMIVVAIVAVACFALRRRAVGIVTALFCYATIVSPVLGVLQSGAQKVADRYTYLSCIPFALLYGAFALRASRVRAWAAFAAWIPLPVLAVLAWNQTHLWADSETFFRRAVEVEPDNYMAQHDLAAQIRLRGDRSSSDQRVALYQEAIEHELASIRAHPERGNEGARHDLGGIYNMLGHVDDAILAWQECLTVAPDTQAVVEELQRIYAQRLTPEGRKAYLEAWIAKSPNSVAAYDFYAQYWSEQKDRAKELEAWRKTLQLDPNWERGMFGVGRLLLSSGKHAEAEAQLRSAVAHNLGDLEAWNLLGRALRAQNKVEEAEACWAHVLSVNPNHAGAAESLRKSQSDSRSGK